MEGPGEGKSSLASPPSSFVVPQSTLARPMSWCVDLVCPSSQRSGCFTKSYGSYLKGTGSLLVMEDSPGGNAAEAEAGPAGPTTAERLMGGMSNTLDEMVRGGRTDGDGRGQGAGDTRPSKRAKPTAMTGAAGGSTSAAAGAAAPWYAKFGEGRIRYFMPEEIARLLEFPEGFAFPDELSLKKRYALVGNSLHVGTVARLLCVLLS